MLTPANSMITSRSVSIKNHLSLKVIMYRVIILSTTTTYKNKRLMMMTLRFGKYVSPFSK